MLFKVAKQRQKYYKHIWHHNCWCLSNVWLSLELTPQCPNVNTHPTHASTKPQCWKVGNTGLCEEYSLTRYGMLIHHAQVASV